MPRAVVVGAVVLLLAGCIAPPAGPVGRADPARAGASPQEIFARDLRFIYEEIRDNYVNLAYKEETLGFDWDELYASYSAQLAQARTEKDFFRLASLFVSELRDGHVMLWPYRGNPEVERRLYDFDPALQDLFTVRLVEGVPIITETELPLLPVGSEILTLNGLSFLKLVEDASLHFFWGATEQAAAARVLANRLYFHYLALISDPFPAQLEITFRTPDGRLGDCKISPQSAARAVRPLPKLDPYPTLQIEDGIARIAVSTFEVDPKEFRTRLEQIAAELKGAGVEGVILDLRGNGGGNESFRDLLSYLVSEEIVLAAYRYRQSPRMGQVYRLRPLYETLLGRRLRGVREEGYSGWYCWKVKPSREDVFRSLPVVVLTDRLVFSSADRFVGAILEHDLAVVVGTEVACTGHGLPTSVLLPSGGYVLNYGFQELRDAQFGHLEGRLRQPHVFAEQTLADYYRGVDTALERAMSLVKQR